MRPKVLGTAVVVTVACVGLLLAALWGLQRRLIYLPGPAFVPPVAEVLPGARDVRLRTADGLELGAWFLPARSPGRGITVLVANGNGGNRSLRAPLAAALSASGFSVLLFDYRGYGGNPGSPTEDGLALDVRAAHRFLTEELGVPRAGLLYFGESLGAAVVTELATEHPPAGLLLRSPFVDLASVARVHYPLVPVGMLLRDRFPVAARLTGVTVPTMVVYGGADTIVPPEQSRTVAAASPSASTVEIKGADHNDRVLLDGHALVRAVIELAAR